MRRTILLADDSPTIHRLVTSTFADAEVDIISVNNGDAAIRKVDEIRPHLVMSDIYMPGKNGYEVCAYVRHHAEAGSTPVILLVGAFDAFDEAKAKELGATAHITKPFEPQALVSLVESVFEKKTEAQQPEPSHDSPTSMATSETQSDESPNDLLGLAALFREPAPDMPAPAPVMTENDLDRIADRVIHKISSQVIENIAWEIVPDITEKIVRDEIRKNR